MAAFKCVRAHVFVTIRHDCRNDNKAPSFALTGQQQQQKTHKQSYVVSLINVAQRLRPQPSRPNRRMIISVLEFIYCGVKIHQYIRRLWGEPLMCTDANVTFNLIGRSRGVIIVISNAPLHQFPRVFFFLPNIPPGKDGCFFRHTPQRLLVANVRTDSVDFFLLKH